MPSDSSNLLASQLSVPSEMRTAEWAMLPQWLRERCFYMAAVHRAEILEDFRAEVAAIASGERGMAESRKRLEASLDARGYQPLPGQAGTIKDLRSMRRIHTSLRTNVTLLQGWGQKQRGLSPGALSAFPGWELVRFENRKHQRIWQERFVRAGGTLTADGRMIAHKLSKVWLELGNGDADSIGTDYPPFAWGSGMGWRQVGISEMKALGLMAGFDVADIPRPRPLSSPNESLEIVPEVPTRVVRDALTERLAGLAEWKGETLVFTDPNGTRPYAPEKLAEVWARKLPDAFADLPGEGQMQREAVRQWAQDHTAFISDPAVAESARAGRLDVWDDVWRAFDRIIPISDGQTVWRGLSFNQRLGNQPWEGFRAFLSALDNGEYLPDSRKPADSWSMAESGARKYATAGRFQVMLVCENPSTARDISPLVRMLGDSVSSPDPAMPVATDGEAVFLNGTRFRVLKVDVQQDTPTSGRATVHVQEII